MADLDEEAAPPPLRKRKAPTKVAFEVGESFRKMRTAEVLKIISKVQENSILWDQTHADYKEVEKKNRVWWDAERELGFLKVNRGSTLRKIWAQLSAEFRRERDRQKKTSGDDGDDVIAEFEYYEDLLFLDRLSRQKTPERSADSTMSVSRRVAQLETKERPEKKTKKEPLSVKDKMLLQCEKIGQVVERALENLEKKEAPSSDEDQDILDYVRNSLRKLDPGRRFELKCELRQLCKDAVEPKKPVGEVNLWESNFGF